MTDALINRETGKEPTAQELIAIQDRAREILDNPYASPEQVMWALKVTPTDDLVFWEPHLRGRVANSTDYLLDDVHVP